MTREIFPEGVAALEGAGLTRLVNTPRHPRSCSPHCAVIHTAKRRTCLVFEI
jgi:hypothetical protein